MNVVILALPLGGVTVLRLYESALVRQTESELIGQAAFLAAAHRVALARAAGATATPAPPGSWQPHSPSLDLALDEVRPPAPAALEPTAPAQPAAVAAGTDVLPIMRDAQVVTLAAIRVVDPQGVIVASTGEDLGRSIAHFEEITRALGGETVSLLRERISDEPEPPLSSISRGTGIRVFVAMPVVESGRVAGAVLLSRTPRSIGQTLWGKRTEIAIGALALGVLVAGLTIFTALTIARPLSRLREQARRAARGERGAVVPLEHPVTADVAELSESFAAMSRALEDREDYLRGFASQVSHELKTPLAAMRGALEILLDHGETMTGVERGRFLGNLAADVDRLDRLVRRLLDLARADVMKPGAEGCDAAAEVERIVERHRRDGLDVHVASTGSPLGAAIGPEALDSLVGSVLDNARQHAGPAAKVAIELRRSGGDAEIVVADDGPGIPPADRERIFEPFFTTSRASGGTGLGLAIARAVAKAHGGRIELEPSEVGSCFRIVLPRSPGR
ncbi:MAG: sensor histidine kinase [Candidatus Binatia bacterium]